MPWRLRLTEKGGVMAREPSPETPKEIADAVLTLFDWGPRQCRETRQEILRHAAAWEADRLEATALAGLQTIGEHHGQNVVPYWTSLACPCSSAHRRIFSPAFASRSLVSAAADSQTHL